MHVRKSILIVFCLLIASLAVVPEAAAAQAALDCDLTGTSGDDVLIGTEQDDVICGLGGDDLLVGAGGNDRLLGGEGDDELVGGDGADFLDGDAGDDELFGGRGPDMLRSGDGDDVAVGGPGSDVLRGGAGADDLAGGDGQDTLWGDEGNDLVRGAKGADVVYGGPGDDVVRGGTGVDRLRGGVGADICIDAAPATNGVNCAFGVGGDDDPLTVGAALWERLGDDEFVYSVSGAAPCDDGFCPSASFAELVHVRGGVATTSFGDSAKSADALFVDAARVLSNGGTVEFDLGHGLPRLFDDGESRLLIHEIELRDELRAAFDAARTQWAEAAIENYAYTVTTVCFCPLSVPLRVTVDDSVDVAIQPLGDGGAEWTSGAKTIEGHFDDIAALLDGHAIEILLTFDEETGVPTHVSVDRDRQLADEEFSLSIADFVVAATAVEGDIVEDNEGPDDEHPADDLPPELRIVKVAGIEVSSVIANDVQALIDAASDDGFVLSGGGFRDPQRQIDLRKANCGTSDFAIFEMPANQCSPPTARPGQSQHELGLAIDFTNSGRLVTSRTDPAFLWLDQNAADFGFINLPSEPWHWSTTGN